MKQLTRIADGYKNMVTLFILLFLQVTAWAQDSTGGSTSSGSSGGGSVSGSSSGSSSTTTSSSTQAANDWYTQPWVWVVGGIILLLIIIALSRGGRSSRGTTDRVTYTKRVTKEDNV
jgi:hypothetical protein